VAGGRFGGAGRLVGLSGAVLVVGGLSLSLLGAPAWAGTSPSVAQAKTHLLVLADLPRGWAAEKGTGGSGGGSAGGLPGGSQLAACIGVPASIVDDNSPSADGPYYQNKDQSLEVQDSITVYPSAAFARKELGAMANAKTPACVATYMNGSGKSLFEGKGDKGATVGTVTVAPLTAQAFGPNVVGIVMTVPITYQGLSVSTEIVSVNAIRGRLAQSITYDAYGASFPASLATHLDSVALGRL